MDGKNALKKNKAGTRGRSALIVVRMEGEGLTEKVTFEQRSEGEGIKPYRYLREKHSVQRKPSAKSMRWEGC